MNLTLQDAQIMPILSEDMEQVHHIADMCTRIVDACTCLAPAQDIQQNNCYLHLLSMPIRITMVT